MTMAMVHIAEAIAGTVSRANGEDSQLAGCPGWLNLSRYADPAPVIPVEGACVPIALDRAGCVRRVERVGTVAAPAVRAAPDAPEAAGAPAGVSDSTNV